VNGEPSGPDAAAMLLAKIEAKNEDERTEVEKEILASKSRATKFADDGAAQKSFVMSEADRRKLRLAKWGPVPERKRAGKKKAAAPAKKAKVVVEMSEEEKAKMEARKKKFATE